MAKSKRDNDMNPNAFKVYAENALQEFEDSHTRNWVEIPAPTIRIGDLIVVADNKRTGQVSKTIKVTDVVFPAKGCRNVHVWTNDRGNIQCYDRVATIKVHI